MPGILTQGLHTLTGAAISPQLTRMHAMMGPHLAMAHLAETHMVHAAQTHMVHQAQTHMLHPAGTLMPHLPEPHTSHQALTKHHMVLIHPMRLHLGKHSNKHQLLTEDQNIAATHMLYCRGIHVNSVEIDVYVVLQAHAAF